jgi:hypothetical protein
MNNNFEKKYFKYKNKYLNFKNKKMIGGLYIKEDEIYNLEDDKNMCIICLDIFKNNDLCSISNCRHLLHTKCFKKLRNNKCPECNQIFTNTITIKINDFPGEPRNLIIPKNIISGYCTVVPERIFFHKRMNPNSPYSYSTENIDIQNLFISAITSDSDLLDIDTADTNTDIIDIIDEYMYSVCTGQAGVFSISMDNILSLKSKPRMIFIILVNIIYYGNNIEKINRDNIHLEIILIYKSLLVTYLYAFLKLQPTSQYYENDGINSSRALRELFQITRQNIIFLIEPVEYEFDLIPQDNTIDYSISWDNLKQAIRNNQLTEELANTIIYRKYYDSTVFVLPISLELASADNTILYLLNSIFKYANHIEKINKIFIIDDITVLTQIQKGYIVTYINSFLKINFVEDRKTYLDYRTNSSEYKEFIKARSEVITYILPELTVYQESPV